MAYRALPRFCINGRLLAGDRSPSSRIHGALVWALWRRRVGWRRKLRLALRVLRWPLHVIAQAAGATSRYAGAIRERTGKGRLRQLAEQLHAGLVYSVPPRYYYLFRLYEDEKRRRVHEYLHRYETKNYSIYRLLQRRDAESQTQWLSNKLRFFEFCQREGLPTPAVLVEVSEGKLSPDTWPVLPPRDLFVKPRKGKGGRGAARWDWVGDDRYRTPAGEERTAEELVEALRIESQSGRGPLLVEPRLVNHPEMRDLGNGALSTARIVTIRNERGEPEPTVAVFRMGVGAGGVVDNIHAGGVACAVDVSSGVLGPATVLDPLGTWVHRHPDTGGAIDGRRLPLWSEALDLVRRAHAPLDALVLVGWDVAITPEGPFLIEGNGSPCVDLLQRPLDRGLASTRFGELLAHHLDRMRETEGGAAAVWARTGLPEGEIGDETEALLLRQSS